MSLPILSATVQEKLVSVCVMGASHVSFFICMHFSGVICLFLPLFPEE